MNLFDFIERFPQENDCLEYFISIRKKTGVVCRKCGSSNQIWLAATKQFECKQCENRINIKSGTVMENSKLPIKYWFMAIHLLTSATETFTIAEIQKKLGCEDIEQVNEMLENLNRCLCKTGNSCSFDQLLFACVANQNRPTVSLEANQSSRLAKILFSINQIASN